MKRRTIGCVIMAGASLVLGAAAVACGGDGSDELILGVTTSVQDAGLLDVLVEEFEDRYDIKVKPIVAGSGQVLEQARRGEVDVILTHSPSDEEALVADGYGIDRTGVMENFFLVAGPDEDPAGVREASTVEAAFARIASGNHVFISRGDLSGTHRREQELWQAVGIDPVGREWYTESATGQGQNLLIADERDAYTLVDTSTFASLAERLALVELLRDVDRPNVYSVVRLSSDRLGTVNAEAGDTWLEFLTGDGQDVIGDFGVEHHGEPLFQPSSR